MTLSASFHVGPADSFDVFFSSTFAWQNFTCMTFDLHALLSSCMTFLKVNQLHPSHDHCCSGCHPDAYKGQCCCGEYVCYPLPAQSKEKQRKVYAFRRYNGSLYMQPGAAWCSEQYMLVMVWSLSCNDTAMSHICDTLDRHDR